MATQGLGMAKELPQLTDASPSKPSRNSARQSGNSKIRRSWREWMRLLRRGSGPAEDIEIATNRTTSPEIRGKKTSDESSRHDKEAIFMKYESRSSGDEDSACQIQRADTHRRKRSEDAKNNKAANYYHHHHHHHHQQNQQRHDPPFDFQLSISPPPHPHKHEREKGPANMRQPIAINTKDIPENRQHHNHHEQHHLTPGTPSSKFDNSYHHLNDCPFYTSEVSNLKIRIIELEYINATLENKVNKYRDEIRLFKKDIKGYKNDARQFTQLLKERENEIEILHRKITQLLNQDSLPLSSLSALSSFKRCNNGGGSSTNSGSRKRSSGGGGGGATSTANDRYSGKYSRTLEHIDEAQSERETQCWI